MKEYFEKAKAPLLINSCEVDSQYPAEKQKIGDEVLGNGTMKGEGYERLYWPGCEHGFSVSRSMLKISELELKFAAGSWRHDQT